MKRDLTDRYLRSLKPPETGRLEVSDQKRVGLRFRLSASGKATWMYEKRVKGGEKRKHTFGAWPEPISLSVAREMALELEAEAARGIDRVSDARAAKVVAEANAAAAMSTREVLDLYTKLHLSSLRRGFERRRQIEQALHEQLDAPVGNLRKPDLQQAVDRKLAEGRRVYANRIRASLMHFTKWAYERDHIESNLGHSLPRAMKEESRDREPTVQEVRNIWAATFEMGPLWGPIFRLLILTAQRRHEILGLEWSEVDLTRRTITKPGSRTKNAKAHVTHLSESALLELATLKEGAGGAAAAGLVFTTTGRTPVSGVSKAKARLDKLLGDGVAPWRLHDLRTAFATAMVEAGVSESVADRILNHSAVGSAPSSVARVYNRANMLSQRAKALDRWAEMVTADISQVIFLEAGSV